MLQHFDVMPAMAMTATPGPIRVLWDLAGVLGDCTAQQMNGRRTLLCKSWQGTCDPFRAFGEFSEATYAAVAGDSGALVLSMALLVP